MDGRLAEQGRFLVLYLVTTLLSLTVHEYAHAAVANGLGDDTPRRQGRLTLSPLAHYDVLGTFIIPIIAVVVGGMPFFAWAKPVETNPANYTRAVSMRNGHRLVAAAGPVSNLVLAAVSMGLAALLLRSGFAFAAHAGTASALFVFLRSMVLLNVGLCVLNFIPLPPLDGSRLLPRRLDGIQQAIAPYSFLILLLFMNFGPLRSLFYVPVSVIDSFLLRLFGLPQGLL